MKIDDKLWRVATSEAAIVIAKRYGAQVHNVPSAYPYEFARESMNHYNMLIESNSAQTMHNTVNKDQEIKEYAWKLYCHACKNYERENLLMTSIIPINTCIKIATEFLAKFDKT